MNGHQKALVTALSGAGFIGAVAGGQYLGGALFAHWEQLPDSVVGVFTLHDYWVAYGDVPSVKKALAACSIVAAVFPFVPIAVAVAAMFSKPKRELHGSARFATPREIRNWGLLKLEGRGTPIIVGKIGDNYLLYWGSEFVMVAAPTRSGKGVAMVIPNLLTYPDSAVVLDVKLENYGYTSLYRQRCGQKVYLWAPFDTAGRTHRWNPLVRIAGLPPHLRVDALQAISSKIFQHSNGRNAFFYESARGMFEGLALYLIETERLCTFGEILRQGMDEKKKVREHFRDMMDTAGLSQDCIGALTRAMSGGDEAMSNVLATFNQGLQIFSNPTVDAATSACDFDLSRLRREQMTIYVGLPANRIGDVGLLSNLFFSDLIELNTDVLPEQDPTIKYHCLLALDEFTAMGYVKHFDKSNAFIAGYWLRMLTIVQAESQMQDPKTYGPHGAQTLIVNHGAHVVYPPKNQKEAESVSESLGYFTERAISTGRNMGKSSSRSENTSDQRRALMLAQELKEMKQDEEIVMGFPHPIRCKKAFFYEDRLFVDRLKALSPSLARLGEAMPTEEQLKAAMMAGELRTANVPETNLADWHAHRDIGRAKDDRRAMTAAERLELDAKELQGEVIISVFEAMADHEFQLTGVRPDVAELLRGLNLVPDETVSHSITETDTTEEAA